MSADQHEDAGIPKKDDQRRAVSKTKWRRNRSLQVSRANGDPGMTWVP